MKVKAERKLAPVMSHLQDVPVAHDKLASHLPPTDELEASAAWELQHVTNLELNVCCFSLVLSVRSLC